MKKPPHSIYDIIQHCKGLLDQILFTGGGLHRPLSENAALHGA